MSDEAFATLVKKTQQFANDRPLTRSSADPQDFPPLRPCDFLGMGERIKGLMPLYETTEVTHHSRHLRTAFKKLWEIFYDEYVIALNKRQKDSGKSHVYRVGDVVNIITGQDIKPTDTRTFAGPTYGVVGRYHLGVIREVLPHKADGLGRVFVVEVSKGRLKKLSAMNIAPVL